MRIPHHAHNATPIVTPAAIVFDLDGTLVDSSRDLLAAVNLTRHEFALPALTHAQVIGMVGDGARKLVERALPTDRHADLDVAVKSFMHHYAACCTREVTAYPGIPETVERLAHRWPLAVLTNKPAAMTAPILAHVGMAPFFRLVLGGDSLPTRKPDPAGLRHIATHLNVEVGDLLLVGDSHVDAATAKHAACHFVYCTWGFGTLSDVLAAGVPVAAQLSHPADLITWLLATKDQRGHGTGLLAKVIEVLPVVVGLSRLIGDKAYDSDRDDEWCWRRHAVALIAPNRRNRRQPQDGGHLAALEG